MADIALHLNHKFPCHIKNYNMRPERVAFYILAVI